MEDDTINDAPLPARVFHYTDAGGLLGIVKTGSLFATDFRFLNDHSELSYAYELAQAVAGELLKEYSGPVEKAFLTAATQDWPHVYREGPYYLTCFTELKNSLGQWRAYSGRQGYSLEFPGDMCSRFGGSEKVNRQAPGNTLVRVEYKVKVQKNYIRNLLRRVINKVCSASHLKGVGSLAEAVRPMVGWYWPRIERVAYRFKHPDFAVEKEWRLVTWWGKEDEEYRPGDLGITPYTRHQQLRSWTFNQQAGQGNLLPIVSVRHGPTPNPVETVYALDRVLNRHGYPDTLCRRKGSKTPVRL